MKMLHAAPSRLRMLLVTLTALSLMSFLSACGTKAGIGVEAACSQWELLYVHPQDTLNTVQQAYASNVKREAFCEGVD